MPCTHVRILCPDGESIKSNLKEKKVQLPNALNAPIATKVVCFSRLLKCLRSLYGKQCGPRSDFPYRSSLFWVHAVCFCFVSNVRQLLAADDFSRRHFQIHFFLCALRVKHVCGRRMRSLLQLSQRWPCHEICFTFGWGGAFISGRKIRMSLS